MKSGGETSLPLGKFFLRFDSGTKRLSKYGGNHKQVGKPKALGERRM